MRVLNFRTLAALIAGATVAACADVPTLTPRAAERPAATSSVALAVSVNCVLYYGTTYDCTAQASGGSGTGYSFTWYGSASEYFDQGGTSKAYTNCYKNGSYPYYTSGYLSVAVMVTDSDGNTASASGSRSC
jgi:hypothetical protein